MPKRKAKRTIDGDTVVKAHNVFVIGGGVNQAIVNGKSEAGGHKNGPTTLADILHDK